MDEYLRSIASGKASSSLALSFLKSANDIEMRKKAMELFNPISKDMTDKELMKFMKLSDKSEWDKLFHYIHELKEKYHKKESISNSADEAIKKAQERETINATRKELMDTKNLNWEKATKEAKKLAGQKNKEGPQMIDEAIQEVEQVIKKKGKREKKPVKTSFEPHDYHKGPWSKIELIEFYKKHGYVPPLQNGKPRKTNIDKLIAEQEKKIKKTTQVSKSGKLSIQFPGPWRKHTGTWKPQEMYDYYKEWGVIPPTKQGKERAITLIDLEYKIKGIKRPKTQGLMTTKATVVKKKEEPKMTEEPVRDLRKLRAMITELYDDLRSEMTEDEKMRYTRLFKEQHFDDVYKFMKQMEKKYY